METKLKLDIYHDHGYAILTSPEDCEVTEERYAAIEDKIKRIMRDDHAILLVDIEVVHHSNMEYHDV